MTSLSEQPHETPPTIFISYRREDTEEFTALVNYKLETHFGDRANVFWDHGDIPPGEDFPEKIRRALAASKALVAIIGPQWLDARDKATGGRRLEKEKDLVRLEIAAALKAGIPVIPVLVKDAEMPDESRLPDDLKPLAHKNALFIRSVRHLDRDVRDLIEALGQALSRGWPMDKAGLLGMLNRYAALPRTGSEEAFADLPPLVMQIFAVCVALLLIFLFLYMAW
jgi:hypothetical protein